MMQSTITESSHALTQLSASELASLIRRKQLSPIEVVDAYLWRIEQLNPTVNAFACLDAENARAEARRAEVALMAGETTQPLLGVPITIKSSIDAAGLRCEAGMRLRAGYVAGEDAPL